MLIETDPVTDAVEATYDAVMDTLLLADITKSVAITALLNVIAEQYSTDLDAMDAAKFVREASEWLDGYFNGTI